MRLQCPHPLTPSLFTPVLSVELWMGNSDHWGSMSRFSNVSRFPVMLREMPWESRLQLGLRVKPKQRLCLKSLDQIVRPHVQGAGWTLRGLWLAQEAWRVSRHAELEEEGEEGWAAVRPPGCGSWQSRASVRRERPLQGEGEAAPTPSYSGQASSPRLHFFLNVCLYFVGRKDDLRTHVWEPETALC